VSIVGADEVFRKISSQISTQFPEFIRDEGPRFVAFLRAYYEYLEMTGNSVEAIRSLSDVQDVDRTLDRFIEYFRREFMPSIPRNVIADKKLLIKHIRKFYRTRGSQSSYKFLFHAMFDKEVEFYYPSDDILRVSDGRWVRETIIRVGAPFSAVPTVMEGGTITGLSSGAVGRVQDVTNTLVNGVSIYEMVMGNVIGTFVDGESITDDSGHTATINNFVGTLQDVRIEPDSTSAFNVVDDELLITSATAAAHGKVAATTDQSAITFRIVNPGSGYRLACTAVNVFGGSGTGASFAISSLTNTVAISLCTDPISALRNVPLNTGIYFVSTGANSATVNPNMAVANVSTTLSNALTFTSATVGSINAISLLSPGRNYSTLPTSEVLDQIIFDLGQFDSHYGGIKGRNAVIVANNAPGAVTSVAVTSAPTPFNKNDSITVSNETRGAAQTIDTDADKFGLNRYMLRNASYLPIVTGVVVGVTNIAGRYIDTRGFLSWNNKLQDSDFYQTFSYVLKVSELVDSYRSIVKSVLHPAGTKMFGFYEINAAANFADTATLSVAEFVTVLELIADTADFSAVSMELSTIPAVESALVTCNADSSLSVWKQAPNYIRIDAANNILSYYESIVEAPYENVVMSTFDGTARIVVSTTEPHWFANGTLMFYESIVEAPYENVVWTTLASSTLTANTGSISVGGPGTNLMIVALSTSVANGMYAVNTIFSNTTLTTRLAYEGGALANGYFYYQIA